MDAIVFSGADPRLESEIETGRDSGLHFRSVADIDRYALIRGARAVLFPSIYEAFGLPVIEAMALGTLVVTSDGSSLTEVEGDAALLVESYSIDSIAWAIRAIEADIDLRKELADRGRQQAKKFSPSAYDERLRRLYEKL